MGNNTRLADTIQGSEGKAYATINGQNRLLFELASIKAQIDLNVISKRMLGNRMTQHKVTGAEGTGSMTLYFMNSEMLRLTIDYINSGQFNGIKIVTVNEDKASTIGKQEVALNNVIPKTVLVASLDDNSDDPITFDTDFTFDSIDLLGTFVNPSNYR